MGTGRPGRGVYLQEATAELKTQTRPVAVGLELGGGQDGNREMGLRGGAWSSSLGPWASSQLLLMAYLLAILSLSC